MRARLLSVSLFCVAAAANGCESHDSGRHPFLPASQTLSVAEIYELTATSDKVPLASVGPVTIDSEGRVYIVEPTEQRVRVRTLEGSERLIGGEGEGPGEFKAIHGVSIQDTVIYVVDGDLGRISAFSVGGTLLGVDPWRPAPLRVGDMIYSPSAPQSLVVRHDGSSLVEPGLTAFEASSLKVGVTRGSMPIPFLLVASRGGASEVVHWKELESTMVGVRRSGEIVPVILPYHQVQQYALLPNGAGIAVAGSRVEEPRPNLFIVLIDLEGDTTLHREFSIPPDDVIADDVHQMLTKLSRKPSHQHLPREILEAALQTRGAVPDRLPAVADLVVGEDLRIWLRRVGGGTDSAFWQIFNQEGRLQANFSLGVHEKIVAARGDLVVTRVDDALGVPTIRAYRLIGW